MEELTWGIFSWLGMVLMSVTQEPRKLRQKSCHKFETSLGYKISKEKNKGSSLYKYKLYLSLGCVLYLSLGH